MGGGGRGEEVQHRVSVGCGSFHSDHGPSFLLEQEVCMQR